MMFSVKSVPTDNKVNTDVIEKLTQHTNTHKSKKHHHAITQKKEKRKGKRGGGEGISTLYRNIMPATRVTSFRQVPGVVMFGLVLTTAQPNYLLSRS